MFKRIALGIVAVALLSSSAMAQVYVSNRTQTTWGNKRVVFGTMLLSGSPTASGFAVTARNVGLTKIDEFIIANKTTTYLEYDWVFNKSGTGGYVAPVRRGWLDYKQVVAPSVQDSFACANIVTLTTDADTTLVLISPVVGPISQFVSGACSPTTAATKDDNQFTNAGGTLFGSIADTLDSQVRLRASWVRADTVFFDYNATAGSRLCYVGTNLGNMGDLYVPWYDGKMIKVTYVAPTSRVAAGIPANTGTLYFCKNGTQPNRFVWKKTTGASLPQGACTNGFYAALPNVPGTVTGSFYFIAIGK